MAWAVITVLWDGISIVGGATHEAYIAATVAALVAGMASFAARQDMPPDAPRAYLPGSGPAWTADGAPAGCVACGAPQQVNRGYCLTCGRPYAAA